MYGGGRQPDVLIRPFAVRVRTAALRRPPPGRGIAGRRGDGPLAFPAFFAAPSRGQTPALGLRSTPVHPRTPRSGNDGSGRAVCLPGGSYQGGVMLVLSRKRGESLLIDGTTVV